jgi:transposase
MQPNDINSPTILLAIELSASTWLVAARVPGSEKPHLHRIDGGDTVALLTLISSLQAGVARRHGATINVVCCFEAGRDGFWLQRFLTAQGVDTHVLEPTSILINRRARRAKTDRLDAVGMLRVLAAFLRGDRQSCSMVRVPTPDEEDAKRTHRERESLVQERVRIENRIEALLFTQGIRKRPSLRSWDRDLAVLRTGDGRGLPIHLRSELDRLRRRLVMTLELIREVESERDEAHVRRRRRRKGPAYSITSSARSRIDCGTARPSASAVLRLRIVTYLTGACTGRSAGFPPRRMRST